MYRFVTENGLPPYLLYILRIYISKGIYMVTKIQKWGNSQGLRIAKHLLDDAHISIGDNVNITTKDGMIIISPIRQIRGKYDLEELLSRIPPDYKTEEIDWGKPVGKEVW
jgi:antitoxin MazE